MPHYFLFLRSSGTRGKISSPLLCERTVLDKKYFVTKKFGWVEVLALFSVDMLSRGQDIQPISCKVCYCFKTSAKSHDKHVSWHSKPTYHQQKLGPKERKENFPDILPRQQRMWQVRHEQHSSAGNLAFDDPSGSPCWSNTHTIRSKANKLKIVYTFFGKMNCADQQALVICVLFASVVVRAKEKRKTKPEKNNSTLLFLSLATQKSCWHVTHRGGI